MRQIWISKAGPSEILVVKVGCAFSLRPAPRRAFPGTRAARSTGAPSFRRFRTVCWAALGISRRRNRTHAISRCKSLSFAFRSTAEGQHQGQLSRQSCDRIASPSMTPRSRGTTAICALRSPRASASTDRNPLFAMFCRCLDRCLLRGHERPRREVQWEGWRARRTTGGRLYHKTIVYCDAGVSPAPRPVPLRQDVL